MVIQQKIDIILEYFVKNQERIMKAASQQQVAQDRMRKSIDKVKNSLIANQSRQKFYAEWSDKLGVNTARVSQIMGNQGLIFNKTGNVVDKAGRKISDLNTVMVKGKRDTQGFQMQWLSVMFAGMALQRTMNGLIKTSLEWVGVNEIMSDTLGLLFLPIAEKVLGWALQFLDWVSALDEDTQKLIGWIVLLGIGFGTLLAAIGQITLGVLGLNMAFGGLAVGGMTQMGTAAGIAGGKIGGLSTKLGTLAKFAGIGITIALMVQDLKEGQVTAAVGMGTLAAGIYTGNPYLIGVGVMLKFVGDEEFQINVYKAFWRILDYALFIGEAIVKALSGKVGEIDFGKLAFWESASTALNELSNEGKLASESLNFLAISNSMVDFNKKMEELNEKVREGTLSYEDFAEESRNLVSEYTNIISKSEDGAFAFTNEAIKVRELEQAYRDLNAAQKLGRIAGALGIGKLEIGGTKILGFQEGGIMPYTGLAYLHAGETIIPPEKSQGIILNISYNVTVSDKREFEAMLKKNTSDITREVQRIIA